MHVPANPLPVHPTTPEQLAEAAPLFVYPVPAPVMATEVIPLAAIVIAEMPPKVTIAVRVSPK